MISIKPIKCPNCKKKIMYVNDNNYNCPCCDCSIDKELIKINDNNTLENPKKHFWTKIHFNKRITSAFLICIFIILISIFCCLNKIDIITEEYTENYNSLIGEYNSLVDKYNELHNKNKSLEVRYEELKSEIDNYKDQRATIDDLNAKLEELHNQYSSLETERNNLQAQVDAKKAEQERIAREQAAQQLYQQQASAGYGTVYWVLGGEVYHSTPDCSTLKRSTNIQSGTVAQSGKVRACKVCN